MKEKILIIDDNEKNVELLKDFIESWGYETIQAYQGRAALELAINEKPDLIILDVMLPGISGFEVCQLLRANVHTWDIAIIMVTALNSLEDRINGFSVGADSFLVKPISYKELKVIIKGLLRKRSQYDALENQEIILDKFYILLQKILGSHMPLYAEARLHFFENVFKVLGKDKKICDQLFNIIRFQPIYKELINKEEGSLFIDELFEGLKCKSWLRPLLAYSCAYPQERLPKDIIFVEEHGLKEIGDICFAINRFDDLLQEAENDEWKAYSMFIEEMKKYECPIELTKAIKRELTNREIRNNIKEYFEKHINMT